MILDLHKDTHGTRVEMFNPSGVFSWVVVHDLVVGYKFNFYVVPNLFSLCKLNT